MRSYLLKITVVFVSGILVILALSYRSEQLGTEDVASAQDSREREKLGALGVGNANVVGSLGSSQLRTETDASDIATEIAVFVYPAEGKLEPSAHLLIVDSLGRKVGRESVAGPVYEELPNSLYDSNAMSPDVSPSDREPMQRELRIGRAPYGEYRLFVLGNTVGSCKLEVRTGTGDRPGTVDRFDVKTSGGSREAFRIVFTADAASVTRGE